MVKLSLIPAALVVAAALAAGPAAAQDAPSVSQSKLLWATINVCDTEDNPDTVGIRGAMPGSGDGDERMHMRFELQFYDRSLERWRGLGAAGDSGFVPVGSGRYKQRQSGRNFTVRPPSSGGVRLRGVVTFEWREDGEVVRRARKRTALRPGATAGADPAGFSVASCVVAA